MNLKSPVRNKAPLQKKSGFIIPTTEGLVANAAQFKSRTTRYADQCRYCEQRHWSDECQQYRIILDRKKQLKGSCYICLKFGHKISECKRNKVCVHCGKKNDHHRSLCPTKFTNDEKHESAVFSEEVFVPPEYTDNAIHNEQEKENL
ncbi:hypothetical protein DPMN_193179 [Dreissena polymorpha]|uniref:CCHC-type domain-containing protein n=1 Tax=Dreissena polymorpha TaxID=45954 RepID=A0A9D3Y087_DREPO|nr:hypothetical protein DPMN_193179 [Dreissena polymorpha]